MASHPTTTRTWILQNKPTSMPNLDTTSPQSTFKLETKELPTLTATQALLKTLYLSNDPAQRGWISADVPPERLYVPPVEVGSPVRAYGIAEVLQVGSDVTSITEGHHVLGTTNWSEYTILEAKECRPVPQIPGIGLTHFLGALGATGLTAYFGLVEVVNAKKEDVVVVSGAAGATGSMVVQIAKHMVGCKTVVGLAGGEEKCDLVKSLGADDCIDYKSKGWQDQLRAAGKAAGGVSLYFDNVGGETLDLLLTCMAKNGRIAACGAISGYNDSVGEAYGVKNWLEIIMMRIEIKGFIVLDHLHKAPETIGKFIQAVKEGKIKLSESMETVVDAKFEEIPEIWLTLFSGGNRGKLITKLM